MPSCRVSSLLLYFLKVHKHGIVQVQGHALSFFILQPYVARTHIVTKDLSCFRGGV